MRCRGHPKNVSTKMYDENILFNIDIWKPTKSSSFIKLLSVKYYFSYI